MSYYGDQTAIAPTPTQAPNYGGGELMGAVSPFLNYTVGQTIAPTPQNYYHYSHPQASDYGGGGELMGAVSPFLNYTAGQTTPNTTNIQQSHAQQLFDYQSPIIQQAYAHPGQVSAAASGYQSQVQAYGAGDELMSVVWPSAGAQTQSQMSQTSFSNPQIPATPSSYSLCVKVFAKVIIFKVLKIF